MSQRARAGGGTIALVPTMGAFHAGHHSLIRAARERCRRGRRLAVRQPGAVRTRRADLAAYPRDEARDAAEAAELGVDVLFAPTLEEVYPTGFATTVRVEGLSDVLEGAERGPGHFAGVCTVVAKLLNIVAPDVAFFGQKDAQQVAVVRRMVRDLDIPVELEVAPDRARARRPGALEPQRPPRARPSARRALALSRALRAAETRGRRRRARRRARCAPPRAPRARRRRARVRRRRRPRHASSRSRPSTAGCSWPSPRASAAPASSTTPSSTTAATPSAGANHPGGLSMSSPPRHRPQARSRSPSSPRCARSASRS